MILLLQYIRELILFTEKYLIMSYKVEIESDEHVSVLKNALINWSKDDHDVHLVSSEGLRIFTQKILLSLHSPMIREIFSDSSQLSSVSLPASAACISSLLRILTEGSVTTRDTTEDELIDLGNILGIDISSLGSRTRKRPATSSGVTMLTLPLKSRVPIHNQVPASSFHQDQKNRMNGNIMRKTSGMTIELKGGVNVKEEKPSPTVSRGPSNPTTGSESLECQVEGCGKRFSDRKKQRKHEYRVHGIFRRKHVKTEDENGESIRTDCTKCKISFVTLAKLRRHNEKQHYKWKCPDCGKDIEKSNIKNHKVTHLPDSEKPFECEFCGKKFCQAGQRSVHIKKYHDNVNFEISNTTSASEDNLQDRNDDDQSQSQEEMTTTEEDDFELDEHEPLLQHDNIETDLVQDPLLS